MDIEKKTALVCGVNVDQNDTVPVERKEASSLKDKAHLFVP